MTIDELSAIGDAMRHLAVDEPAPAADARKAQQRMEAWQIATTAVHRYNAEIAEQRRLLEAARARQAAGQPVPDDLAVALRAAAVQYQNERERIVRRFGLRARSA